MLKIRVLLFGIILFHYLLIYSISDKYQLSLLFVEDGLSHNQVSLIVQEQYDFCLIKLKSIQNMPKR